MEIRWNHPTGILSVLGKYQKPGRMIFFMANLGTNQTDGNRLCNVNRYISCKIPECFKLNYDTV